MTSNEHAADQTFLFADLVGYSALTELRGDEAAADLALAFCAELNRLLPACGEDIKMLGDACLVRVDEADCAVTLAGDLAAHVGPQFGFPAVRVGMDTGGAVRRGADYFGHTLNVASRVVELAAPGEVLLTDATRSAAALGANAEFIDRGRRSLRHLSQPYQLWALASGGGPDRLAPPDTQQVRVPGPRRPSGDR